MKKYIITIMAIFASLICANAQISGSMQFLSAKTNKPIKSARIGQPVLVKLSVKDMHLLTNKNVDFSYALSVVPKGSKTPTQISGKLAGKFVLPASEGGLSKTRQETADWKGTQSTVEQIVIPDFMPVGVATVTITITAKGAGSVSINRKLKIVL